MKHSFTTSKMFRFSAAHALDHLAEGRQCAKQHGHNYTVEVIMRSSTLSSDSFVRDPIDYRRIELFIRRTLDRSNLNEIFAAEFEGDAAARICIAGQPRSEATQEALEEALRTTTENIARCIFWRLQSDYPEIVAVKVADDIDRWAQYGEE